jgi:hypothetical protein
MKIDETINKWFDEIEDKLQQHGQPKNNIDNMTFASLSLIDNYLNTILMIVNNGSRLPAMALLRVLNQFVSRIVWVLMGYNKDESELQNRFDSWVLTSYKKKHKFLNNIAGFYAREEKNQFESTIKIYEQEIDKLKKAGVKELPQPEQILEEVFGTKLIAIGQYSRLHKASHPDLIVLGKTFKNNGTHYMYDGDVDEKINDLKFECLICAHRFFKEICRYYKVDSLSQKIESEFNTLIPKSYMKN